MTSARGMRLVDYLASRDIRFGAVVPEGSGPLFPLAAGAEAWIIRADEVSEPRVELCLRPQGVGVSIAAVVRTPAGRPTLGLRLLAALRVDCADPRFRAQLAGSTAADAVLQAFAGRGTLLPAVLRVSDFMRLDPIALREGENIVRALAVLRESGLGVAPVVDEEGDLRGILDAADLLRLALPEHLRWLQDPTPWSDLRPLDDLAERAGDLRVADLLGTRYLSLGPDDLLAEAARVFLSPEAPAQIWVVDGTRLRGVVRWTDLVAWGLGP